ncbi:MAG: GNA1162 family protein [Candidatus Manganitrophaceae bacterium]
MGKSRIGLLIFGAVVLFQLNGCAGLHQPIIPVNSSNPIRTIAILPMLNNTDDVEGPKMARVLFHEKIQNYHYDVKPLKETDEILNLQMGISLGKQLDLTTAQKLGETLGVDGVFYGYLINFDEVTTGIYNSHEVRMGWKLVNTKTGEIAWGRGVAVRREEKAGGVGEIVSAGSQIKNATQEDKVNSLPTSSDPMKEMPGLGKWILLESRSHGGGAVAGLAAGLGGKLIDGITGNRLKYETNAALRILFSSGMLSGPGGGNQAVPK